MKRVLICAVLAAFVMPAIPVMAREPGEEMTPEEIVKNEFEIFKIGENILVHGECPNGKQADPFKVVLKALNKKTESDQKGYSGARTSGYVNYAPESSASHGGWNYVNSEFAHVHGYFNDVDGSDWSAAFGSGIHLDQSAESVAVGMNSGAMDAAQTVAIGKSAQAYKAENATVIGHNAKVDSAANGTALGEGTSVTKANAVALGAGSVADEEGTVSVGKSGEGGQRRITNVAAAKNDNDAVTLFQLKNPNEEIVTKWKNILNINSGGGSGSVDLTKVNQRIDANAAAISDLNSRLNRQDKDMRRGIATQAALNGLFQPYSVKRLNVSAAIGGFKNEQAIAVGAGYRPNATFAVKAGLSTSFGSTSAYAYNVGVNCEF